MPRPKLTNEQVEQIGQMRRDGFRLREIAEELGCSEATVSLILRGRRRKGQTPDVPAEQLHGYHGRTNLNPDKVRKIIRRYSEGYTLRQLAEEFGCSAPTIFNVIHRKHWKHVELRAQEDLDELD